MTQKGHETSSSVSSAVNRTVSPSPTSPPSVSRRLSWNRSDDFELMPPTQTPVLPYLPTGRHVDPFASDSESSTSNAARTQSNLRVSTQRDLGSKRHASADADDD